ncbi:MAG: universal stress protein [Chitinophagales bacterium]|nr:universal stress protein [Chitinophagales bacterium]
MSILFPTDFSEQSTRAFGYALEFAKKMNSTITLLHVYRLPVSYTGYDDPRTSGISEEVITATEHATEERLKLFKEELMNKYMSHHPEMVRVLGMLRMGFPGEETIRVAEEISASHIVMHVEHKKKINRVLFGSTTVHVMKKSKAPVITIPENYEFHEIKKIAYATDLTFSDNEIISRLLALAELFDAEVKCFHVHDSNLKVEGSIIDDFIEQYKSEANKRRITFQLIDNLSVLDGIEYFVKENQIDLLAIMKQKHYWLDFADKDISKQLAFHADVPLLVYHE